MRPATTTRPARRRPCRWCCPRPRLRRHPRRRRGGGIIGAAVVDVQCSGTAPTPPPSVGWSEPSSAPPVSPWSRSLHCGHGRVADHRARPGGRAQYELRAEDGRSPRLDYDPAEARRRQIEAARTQAQIEAGEPPVAHGADWRRPQPPQPTPTLARATRAWSMPSSTSRWVTRRITPGAIVPARHAVLGEAGAPRAGVGMAEHDAVRRTVLRLEADGLGEAPPPWRGRRRAARRGRAGRSGRRRPPPACRIDPPSRFRSPRARVTTSSGPARREPTGRRAPS